MMGGPNTTHNDPKQRHYKAQWPLDKKTLHKIIVSKQENYKSYYSLNMSVLDRMFNRSWG
jgi:hypothetical protein